MPAHEADPRDRADLTLLEEAARRAGAVLASHYGKSIKVWSKGHDMPVTEADMAANALLRETLMGARPDYGWLSEENDDGPERLDAQSIFVVDPLDGTRGFLKGAQDFTVSLAVVRDGRPAAAVVYGPMQDALYTATQGGGAHCDGVRMAVSDQHSIEGARMLAAKAMFDHPAWPERWPHMEVTKINSVAYRLALVASGAYDATIAMSHRHDWDIAAGDLLVQEAGGRMTAHDGSVLRYNRPRARQLSMLAAGPALHALLLERVGRVPLPAV